MPSEPLVSICCTTYNHEEFIRDAIEGFLMQEVDFPIEILINDDASTDGTPEILHEYEERYPELIRVIYQEENQYSKGVRPFINILYPQARGTYIALCEGDDYWTDPLKLKKQVSILQRSEDMVGCITNALIEDHLTTTDTLYVPKLAEGRVPGKEFVIRGGGMFPTASLMYRNIDIDYDLFDALPELNGDTLLIYLLMTKGEIYYDGDVTCVYRKWAGGVYSSITYDYEAVIACNKVSIIGYQKLREMNVGRYRELLNKRISKVSLYILTYGSLIEHYRYLSYMTTLDLILLVGCRMRNSLLKRE